MTAARPARVILLGGTFDPVHCGHLAVAAQASRLLDAEQVWLVPAGIPPHREATLASAADREAMVRAAVVGRADLRIADVELRRDGPSYSSDTVAALAAAHPDVEQWFLLGADAAREIGGWHALGRLLEIVRFVLVNRDGVGTLTLAEAVRLGFDPARTRVVRVDSPPISATEVRRRVAAGLPLDGWVPEAVAAIIAARGLYGAARPTLADNGPG